MSVLETWTGPRPVKLTATDFWQLAKAGAFQHYTRTELIDGVIVAMSPCHFRHALVHGEFQLRLAGAVRAAMPGYRTALSPLIAISDDNVPEPDIVVTSYRGRPSAVPVATIPLVVEISDSTARHDRTTQARIYAAGGIPEYWVVDVEAAEVVRFACPAGGTYGEEKPVPFGESVTALTIGGLSVETAGLVD